MPAGRANLEPGVRSPQTSAAVAGEKPGSAAPSDADFNRTPPNGTIVVNNDAAYIRIGGEWEELSVEE